VDSGLGSRVGEALGVVVEDRCEPALGFLDRPSLARSIVLDLIAADLADAEIARVGMREVEA